MSDDARDTDPRDSRAMLAALHALWRGSPAAEGMPEIPPATSVISSLCWLCGELSDRAECLGVEERFALKRLYWALNGVEELAEELAAMEGLWRQAAASAAMEGEGR